MSHFGLGLISGNGVPETTRSRKSCCTWTAATAGRRSRMSTLAELATHGPHCRTLLRQRLPLNSAHQVSTVALADSGYRLPQSQRSIRALAISQVDFGTTTTANRWPRKGHLLLRQLVCRPTQWAWSIDFASDKVQYQLSNGSGQTFVSGAANINSGWHHVEMSRASGTVRGFVDGVLDVTFSWPGSLPASTGPLRVGRGITTETHPSS